MERYRYTYGSLGELLTVADQPKPHNAANSCAWDKNETQWAGGTREEAFDMARTGWAEGRKNMVEAMAQARPSVTLAPAFTLDVGGAYPDPSAAAAGVPDCMVHFTPEESRHRPIVRLAVNIWASSAYKSREFTNYGAAVLSYIDAIESTGARVELTMLCHCLANNGPRAVYTASAIIKRAEEPMDIDRAAYCLTHVSMLRRIFFGHMQLVEGAAGKMTYCGSPANPEEQDVEPGQIVIPGINTISPGSTSLKTPSACAKHISSTMEKILTGAGVDLPELAFGAEA